MSRAKIKREREVARLKRLVKKVLDQLPDDVYMFVMDHCLFVEFHEEDHALCVDSEGRWVIVLKIPYKISYNPTEMQATIAHEIAHAFLQHRESHTIELEVDAAVLAHRWGFIGQGANPAYQRAIWEEGADEA